MKRKRLHPKVYRNTPLAVFAALDTAISDDCIILHKWKKDLEGKIIGSMSITNPKYETKT